MMIPDVLDAMLLYPPISDPTSPYHSLVYVASHARALGFANVEIRDTNIEALTYCARPDVLRGMMASWEARRRRLSARPALNRLDQLRYLYLIRAQALDPDGPARAIATLRDPDTFYDYASYRESVRTLQLWMNSLSCDAFPGQFNTGGNGLARGLFNLSSAADLTDPHVLDRVVGPLRRYYRSNIATTSPTSTRRSCTNSASTPGASESPVAGGWTSIAAGRSGRSWPEAEPVLDTIRSGV
jgi:hypothetical protein